MGDEQRRDTEGFFFLGAYIACIPLANWIVRRKGRASCLSHRG
jgi:hypothetical protein